MNSTIIERQTTVALMFAFLPPVISPLWCTHTVNGRTPCWLARTAFADLSRATSD